MDRPTSVYFLVVCGQRRWIKVGMAHSVTKRLRSIQAGMPMFKVRVAASVEYPTRDIAERVEGRILEAFRADRVKNGHWRCEWLNITPALREMVRAVKGGQDLLPMLGIELPKPEPDWRAERVAMIADVIRQVLAENPRAFQ